MSKARTKRAFKDWSVIIAVLLLVPLPFTVLWSLLDGITYWSWHEALRTAGLAYAWELAAIMFPVGKVYFDSKREQHEKKSEQQEKDMSAKGVQSDPLDNLGSRPLTPLESDTSIG